MSDPKAITPLRAYTVEETAGLLSINPDSLRRKLMDKNRASDPFIQKANPVKIGKEWRFTGVNILEALGTPAIYPQSNTNEMTVPNNGGAPSLNTKQTHE